MFEAGIIGIALMTHIIPCAQDNSRGAAFLAVTDFSQFTRTQGISPEEIVLTSPPLDAPIEWHELIVSWNVQGKEETFLKMEARPLFPERETKYYILGLWSPSGKPFPRESVNGQSDADGEVKTDILVLNQPARRLQIRLTLRGGETAVRQLRFIGLSFWDKRAERSVLPPNRAAWGKTLEVPQRSQLSYEGGRGWCSPTTVSMVLAYWAKQLKRPELDKEVPEVAAGVHDPQWQGTGNWPFNTAFAGSFSGMRAYVTRLTDVSELEDWIKAGVPVILSVSYRLLKGKESGSEGHLVICVGFTRQGDVVVNDPWAKLEEGETVRKTFPRKNLIEGWGASNNTVYLIYPDSITPPKDRFGHWSSPTR